MHYDVPLSAGLCCQVKAPQSAQPDKPEVPTTSEPFSCSVRVLAAVTDCDRTKEAMVEDIPSFFFPFPSGHERGAMNVSVMHLRDPQDEGPAVQLSPNWGLLGNRGETPHQSAGTPRNV